MLIYINLDVNCKNVSMLMLAISLQYNKGLAKSDHIELSLTNQVLTYTR